MTSPLARFRSALASAVVQDLGLGADQVEALERQIRVPEAGRGDLALPCFTFAKLRKQNPPDVARQVADALEKRGEWAKVEAVGPYVNVTVETSQLANEVVAAARRPGWGTSESGRGKTVVIDFSSPNIAKPLAFHHVRSTVIGAAIGRLHHAAGWRVAGLNYLGDWGKQFGLLATGFLRYGDPARRSDPKHLIEVYVRSNREADVGSRREAIARPAEARKLLALHAGEHARLGAEQDPAASKKLERSVRGLERKVKEALGLEDGEEISPPRVEAALHSLEQNKAVAEAELPLAEARDQEARLFFKRLEEKEPEALREWKEFRDTSIAEFQRVYERMGIEFTSIEGESRYTDVLDGVLARVRARPGTRADDGAEVVDLPKVEKEPPILLKTRDGTTLYLTRDIAAAIDRHERFAFDRSLYVVAADQSLHFEQLFRTLDAMGLEWSKKCHHVPFGRVHGMSTRRGSVIFLDEVLDEAVEKAREICEQSDKIDRTDLAATVEAIGVGSIVFGDLKNLRTSDYAFRLEDVINFDGHTAPYVQFSHARACSILRKGGGAPASANLDRLVLEEERAVLNALAGYPDVIEAAAEAFEPSLLTRALLELAQVTAHYLTAGNRDRTKRILVEDDDGLRAARLSLVDAVRGTLAHGLGLLGVRAPESM